MAEQDAGDAADELRDFDLNEPIDTSKGLRSGLTRYIYLLTVFRAPSMTPELTRPTCCLLLSVMAIRTSPSSYGKYSSKPRDMARTR